MPRGVPASRATPRAPARALPPEAPKPAGRSARTTTNTWWCPWDDRAMQHKDPCDVCGATLDRSRSTAVRTEQ